MRSLTFKTEQRQQQALTPRLQQAVRLLQLSSLDFAQEVQAALDKNPFLEVAEEEDGAPAVLPGLKLDGDTELASDTAGLAPVELPQTAAEAPPDADDAGESDSGASDDMDRELWQTGTSGTRQGGDGETSVIDLLAAESSLRQNLHVQLNVMALPERECVMAKVIVESLDDDGYLRDTIAELCRLCELDPPAQPQEMLRALQHVQSLEPAGVGARTVAECLLLQLHQLNAQPSRDLAERIVAHHLDRLVKHDVAGLARELCTSERAVEQACECIRRLDPRPGWRHSSAVAPYITPDVIVRKQRGEWLATLSSAVVPRVRLNQMYADLFQRHRDGKHGELAAHLQEARWTIRNVEQRFATILQVAQAIIRRQKNFLEFGALAMRPLALKEIAEEVGLHESTVSRVTNNKYMATPAGVFELKYFFSRAMPTATGGTCSATAIRGVIQTMIDEEAPLDPLSDAEIARRLARQGLTVARRTVTKYRQAMRIAPVDHRRRVA